MGIFLQTSCEVRNAGSETKNKLIIKVIDYINRNLRNNEWQESIAGQLRKLEEQYSHKTLFIILRLFDIKDISEGKLKSFARYKKKDDKLVIDQMLVLNEFSDLPENEMRIKMCDEIFEYVEGILIKYKDRFQDFNAIAFIPIFKERIEEIKEYKLKDDYVDE